MAVIYNDEYNTLLSGTSGHDLIYNDGGSNVTIKTGARSLKGIIEDVMLDVMFDIPKSTEPRRVVITEACIKGEESPQIFPLEENILSEESA